MKLQILSTTVLAVLASTSAFSADYVYKTSDVCAKGLTLTFTTSNQDNILQSFMIPLTECTQLENPQGPGDNGCRASKVVGQTLSFKIQLGTLQYTDNQGEKSSGEIDVLVTADLRDGSGDTAETLVYNFDPNSASLNTPNAAWGDGLDEYDGTGLNPLPAIGGVKKAGNQFPAFSGYLDGVLQNLDNLNVYSESCPKRTLAVRVQ